MRRLPLVLPLLVSIGLLGSVLSPDPVLLGHSTLPGWATIERTAAAKERGPIVHTVSEGHTLGKIAKRYNVSIDAICYANSISRKAAIQPGQKLVVPARSDKDGKQAQRLVRQGKFKAQGVGDKDDDRTKRGKAKHEDKEPKPEEKQVASSTEWKKYRRPARRKGYVILEATGRKWRGYAIVKGNKISDRAHRAFQRTLYSWRTGEEHEVDSRLIRLLTQISDTFGGRPLKIASGYREHSHSRESKHKSGRACDFSVVGVPNEALRDYLLTLDGVGVGYYPNSSFVHLDVRKKKTSWVDRSGPGEAPRYDHHQQSRRDTRDDSQLARADSSHGKD